MIFDRLCVGTANWGKEYNGAKVSEDDQKRILDYCREVGIDMIDTAEAYENNVYELAPDFKIVDKGEPRNKHPKNCYGYLSHGWIWIRFWEQTLNARRLGVSVYEPKNMPEFGTFGVPFPSIIQIPYSIYDRRAEPYFPQWKEGYGDEVIPEIHVRSVFLRGKLLENYSPHDCIAFCLMNPYVDRVILGADSYSQFVYNLTHFDGLCEAKKEDVDLLDPRRWKNESVRVD